MGATFTIGLHLDEGRLRQQLAGIHNEIEDTFSLKGGMVNDIQAATRAAKVLETALSKATTNKGISFSVLNSELKKAGITAAQMTSDLAKGGERFRTSLNAANAALALSNRQTISLNKHLQAAAHSLVQSFKYTTAQRAWSWLFNTMEKSVTWVKNLNDAVNDIAVVTGKAGREIEAVTQQAIKGSRELRVTAQEYAEGALIFYQQGLNDKEVQRRNEITIKAAKAAGESIEEMSSQLTAIWNTYKMNGDQQLKAASVGAKMAAQTAVQFKDIAEAMRSAAAPAAQMGVSYESLASIIATVGDTTQQSASVIGNAFKTIFSRFQQLQVDGTDGEITLKKLSAQIQAMGVQVLDTTGNLLPVDQILQQIGEKWDKWTAKQQTAMAQLAGGTRQYGQFLALMENYDKYLTNLREAQAETGTALEQQYSQAIDSIEVRQKNASEAWRRAVSNAFDVDNIKDFYAISEKIAETVGVLSKVISGIPGALLIAAIILREKIWPALQGATSFVKEALQNTTTAGRQRSINATYDEKVAYHQGQITQAQSKLSSGTLTGAEQRRQELIIKENQLLVNQAENERLIALANEQNNTLLQTANGELRVGVELRKSALDETLKLQTAMRDAQKPFADLRSNAQLRGALAQVNWAEKHGTLSDVEGVGEGLAKAARHGLIARQRGVEQGYLVAEGDITAQQGALSLARYAQANSVWGRKGDIFKPELADLHKQALSVTTQEEFATFLPEYQMLMQQIIEENTSGDEKLSNKLTALLENQTSSTELIVSAIQAENFSQTGIYDRNQVEPQTSTPTKAQQVSVAEVPTQPQAAQPRETPNAKRRRLEEERLANEYDAFLDEFYESQIEKVPDEYGSYLDEIAEAQIEAFEWQPKPEQQQTPYAAQADWWNDPLHSHTLNRNEELADRAARRQAMGWDDARDYEDFWRRSTPGDWASYQSNAWDWGDVFGDDFWDDFYPEMGTTSPHADADWWERALPPESYEAWWDQALRDRDRNMGVQNPEPVHQEEPQEQQKHQEPPEPPDTGEEDDENRKKSLRERLKTSASEELKDKGALLGSTAASAMTGLTLSNSIDTIGDASATLQEKVGSAVGSLGSLATAMTMITGPIGAVIFAISIAIPIISKLADYIGGARERERAKIEEQISTMQQGLTTYDDLTEKMKEMNDVESAEYKQTMVERTQALQDMIKEAKFSVEERKRIFEGGSFNRDEFEKILEEKQNTASDMDAEDMVTEAEKHRNKAVKNIEDLGFTGDLTEVPASYADFVKLLQENGVDTTSEEAARHMQEYYEALSTADLELAVAKDALNELTNAAQNFNGLDTLADVEGRADQITASGEELDYNAYSEALIRLGSSYDFAKDEMEEFQNLLLAGQNGLSEAEEKSIQLAETQLKMAIASGEYAKAYKLNGASVSAQAKELAKAYNLDAQSAAYVAAADQRLNRGLKTLKENMSDWKSTVNKGIKTNQDYADTVVAMTETIGDLIGAAEGFEIPKTFDLAENFQLIEDAATGSEAAILKLGTAITKAQIDSSEMDFGIMNSLYADWDSDRLAHLFDIMKAQAKSAVDEMQTYFSDLSPGAAVGDPAKQEEWAQSLNAYARATGMTVEQMNAMLGQIGVQANVVETPVNQDVQVPIYQKGEKIISEERDDEGNITERTWETWSNQVDTKTMPGQVMVAQISTDPNMGGPNITYTGKTSSGPSPIATQPKGGGGGGSGGGGGKGSKFKPKNAKSVAASGKLGERYTNINSYIDKNTKSIDKLSKAQEDAWGSKAYRNLLGVNELLGQQGQYLQKLRAEAKDYLGKDLNNLQRIMRGEWQKGDAWEDGHGYGLVTKLLFDEDTGIIHNWEDVLNELETKRVEIGEELDKLNEQWDREQNSDNETLQDAIDAKQREYDLYMEWVNSIQEAYKTEQDTVGVLHDTAEKQVELIKEWMSNMIELAQIKLELKISISEREIKRLDHLITLWGDLGTEMSKTWENYKQISLQNVNLTKSSLGYAKSMVDLLNVVSPDSQYRAKYEGFFGPEAWADYLENGSHPKAVMDELKKAYDDSFSYMIEAQNNFRAMLQEWLKLFQYYMERFERISTKLSQNTNILDMFTSLLNVNGRSSTVGGTEALLQIAQAKFDTGMTSALLAKGQYELATSALADANASLEAFYAIHGEDRTKYTEAELIYYQELQNQIKEVTDAKNQAFDDVTNGIKDMAASLTEILESLKNNLYAVLFKNLGGLAYDSQSGLDLYGAQKENNSIYVSALDKSHALDKLAGQITAYLEENEVIETEYLKILDDINEKRQEGVDLTQLDLDVLQKRFELQQAIDAYEDAQKFKNTMRLSRDTSGNWSYVYSGNNAQNENDLRQAVADKEYELRKMQMDSLDDYQQKWYETAMAIADLWNSVDAARYESDEKYRAEIDEKDRILQERLTMYKNIIVNLENETGTAHSDTMLAWITGTDDGITTMEGLHNDYVSYLNEFSGDLISLSSELVSDFNEKVDAVAGDIEGLEGDYTDLEDLVREKTDDMIDENSQLREEIDSLAQEGMDDLHALSIEMRSTAESMIADLNATEAAVYALKAALDSLEKKSLDEIEDIEIDPGINQAGRAFNTMISSGLLGSLNSGAISVRDAVEQFKTNYPEAYNAWYTKYKLYGDGTNPPNPNLTKSGFDEYLVNFAFPKALSDISSGITQWDTKDDRFSVSQSSTGNYFARPGITTIAENGPEIVLNPEDTRNILAAVHMVRSTVNNGLGYSASVGLGIASHNASIGSMGGAGLTVQTPVQQAVSIDANFPNVNVANEVETALDSLILQATQYAAQR